VPQSVVPPRPERFRPESTPRPQPQATQQVNKTEPSANRSAALTEQAIAERSAPERPAIERLATERSGQILAPRFPGFDPHEASNEGDFLGDLLSGMRPFMDVQPVVTRSPPVNQVAASESIAASDAPTFPSASAGALPGSISYIGLDNVDERPRIIVRWSVGDDILRDTAQIDILRSSTKDGQWAPIAINLQNTGEYWWYLSPEDLRPFYVAVRIRSLHSGSSMDVTQRQIEIDPRLAMFPSQRP
jgi:hypothetical protein